MAEQPDAGQGLVPLDGFYHYGLVVPDLEAALAELTATHGLQWATVQHRVFELRQPNGLVTADFRFTYSVTGPPHFEIIAATPGTVWDPSTAAGVHHLGYWTHDLRGDAQRLSDAGYQWLATYDNPDDAEGLPFGFTYHWLPTTRTRVELVDIARKPAFEAWLAGGEFPAATEPGGMDG